jgi:hypothetical protein
MDRIEIEQYKGQTIEYDVDKDKFVCDITLEDRTKTTNRASLKDVRKEIDSFIKTNLEFKKFQLFQKDTYGNDLDVISVDGIRTDGKFTCRNEKYQKKGYDFVDFEQEIRRDYHQYFVFDADILKQMKEIKEEEEGYRVIIDKKEKALIKKLKKFDIKDVKKYTDAFAKS